jgi:hypothetical protein
VLLALSGLAVSWLEELEQELLRGSWLGESEGAVAGADGGEGAELVEDFAAGALLQQPTLVGADRLEAAADGALDESVEE